MHTEVVTAGATGETARDSPGGGGLTAGESLTQIVKVYVSSDDRVTESGLRSQLQQWAADSTRFDVVEQQIPATAAVALLGAPAVDDRLLDRIEQLQQGGCQQIVAVVAYADDVALSRLIEAGGTGLLRSTDASPSQLGEAVAAAASGGGTVPPDLLGRFIRSLRHLMPTLLTDSVRRSPLPEREAQVLRLLAEGLDTNEVACELHFSERTIKGAVQSVLRRFGLRNRPHAVAFALRQGLI